MFPRFLVVVVAVVVVVVVVVVVEVVVVVVGESCKLNVKALSHASNASELLENAEETFLVSDTIVWIMNMYILNLSSQSSHLLRVK